jgi:hypothetical protein
MGRGFDSVNLVFTVQPCEDNERSCYSVNQNVSSPIYKELAQHSTVTFMKVLNVSYTMSSPINRPRNKVQRDSAVLSYNSGRNTSDIGNSCESNQNIVNINNSNNNEYAERHHGLQIPSMFKTDKDGVHWSKNCAAFLSFHR